MFDQGYEQGFISVADALHLIGVCHLSGLGPTHITILEVNDLIAGFGECSGSGSTAATALAVDGKFKAFIKFFADFIDETVLLPIDIDGTVQMSL